MLVIVPKTYVALEKACRLKYFESPPKDFLLIASNMHWT